MASRGCGSWPITLEFLDSGGVPRLRVNPPRVEQRALDGAPGPSASATLEVSGCETSTDPRPPWRIPVTPPGAHTCRLTVRWSDVRYPLIVDPAWTDTQTLNEARFDFVLIDVNLSPDQPDEVFAFGGATDDGGVLDTVEFMRVEDAGPIMSWPGDAGAMAHPRTSHAALGFTVTDEAGTHHRVLIAGGSCCQGDAGCHCAGSCAEGTDCDESQTTAEVYDLDEAKVVAPYQLGGGPYPHPTLTSVGDQILILGGPAKHGEVFDGGSWTATGDVLSTPRVLHSATAVDGGAVLACGGVGAIASTTCDLFHLGDLDAGEPIHLVHPHFGPAASYSAPTHDVLIAAGATYDDAGAVSTTGITERVRLRDGGSSAVDGDTIFATTDFAVTTRADGVVILTGGVDQGDVLSSAWAYDPWLPEVDPDRAGAHARRGHAQTLTQSGSLLAAGGVGPSGHALKYANFYNALRNGATCVSPLECASTHCSHNVCCNRECGGCESCLRANTGEKSGTCGPVQAGLDPLDTCGECGVASCDGDGGCQLQPGSCGPVTCDADAAVLTNSACTRDPADDGGHPLVRCGPQSCAPYNCHTVNSEATCFKNGCTDDTECAPNHKCQSSHCEPPCKTNFDCGPGSECAVDGFCDLSVPVPDGGVSCAAVPGVAQAGAACASIALALLGVGVHLRRRRRRG